MQRMVFPLQIAHCGFDGDEPIVAGDLPSLTERLVVVVDDGQMRASQAEALLAVLSGHQTGPVWRCSVIQCTASSEFTRQLGVVTTDSSGVFGCGLDVLGYCRNLPSLYRTA
jgi:hypoxanthine-guanine phosphoribosyltransferase